MVDELPQGKHWIHEVKHDGYLLAGAIILQRREHVEDRIAILKGHLEGTGRQFIDMRADETKALVGHLDFNWFETAIIDQRFLNSIFAFVLVVGALLYIHQVDPAAIVVLFAVIAVMVWITFRVVTIRR